MMVWDIRDTIRRGVLKWYLSTLEGCPNAARLTTLWLEVNKWSKNEHEICPRAVGQGASKQQGRQLIEVNYIGKRHARCQVE